MAETKIYKKIKKRDCLYETASFYFYFAYLDFPIHLFGFIRLTSMCLHMKTAVCGEKNTSF